VCKLVYYFYFRKVDEDTNSNGFDFVIDHVVVNKVIKEPENGI
jgi:hypothetical protein